MPRSASKRTAKVYRLPTNRRRASSSLGDLAALFDIGPYDRNQITMSEINQLRNWIDTEGLPKVARDLELSEVVVLRVCAGFGHRLMPSTARKVREYFHG